MSKISNLANNSHQFSHVNNFTNSEQLIPSESQEIITLPLPEILSFDELGQINSEINIILEGEKTKFETERLQAALNLRAAVTNPKDIDKSALNLAKDNLIKAEINLKISQEINDEVEAQSKVSKEIDLPQIRGEIEEKNSSREIFNDKEANVYLLIARIEKEELLKEFLKNNSITALSIGYPK